MVFLAYPKDLQAQPLGGFLHCCLAPAPAQAGMRRAGMPGMRPLPGPAGRLGHTDGRVFPRETPPIQRACIPTLIVLDAKGEVITRQGRVEVLNDVECREFPWHPKPVLELTDSNAVQLNEGPCLVLFVDSEDDGESEAAKQLIQPIAEKIIAKYKAKEEEAPLLFFVAGEDDMTDSLRDYTNLPEAAPLLTILDMSARAKYVMDVEEITPEIVEAFVSDFLADKLKPEPI
uniref:Nucleoredoxin n=1 Tax=Zonotrichia albicollis TaxID=44394 RepID=A0A8D2QIU9_ZONAL